MKKKNTWSQRYREILTNQSFDELEPYRNIKRLGPMSSDDKEILARLFVAQGANQLVNGDERAQESFGLAEQVAPKSAQVFYEIGCVFCRFPKNLPTLLAACDAFERATQLKPLEAKSWKGWADALVAIGELEEDQAAFEKAQRFYQKAETLIPEGEGGERANLFHKWGKLWAIQGAESGEAVDLHNALDCFRRAEALGLNIPTYWNDYAGVMRRLSHLMTLCSRHWTFTRKLITSTRKIPIRFSILPTSSLRSIRLREMTTFLQRRSSAFGQEQRSAPTATSFGSLGHACSATMEKSNRISMP